MLRVFVLSVFLCVGGCVPVKTKLFDLFNSAVNHAAILDLYKNQTTPFDVNVHSLGTT